MTERDRAIDLYNLGNSHLVAHRYSQAAMEFRSAIEQDDSIASVHINLGNCLFQLDSTVEAIAEYHVAIKLEPRNYLGHFNLARALYSIDDFDGAVAAMECAAGLSPDDALVFQLLMANYATVGQTRHALYTAVKAIRLAPLNPSVYVTTAETVLLCCCNLFIRKRP